MAGLPLRDRVRSAIVRGGLRVEPMFLHIERRQLRWFGYLTRMPPFTWALPTGRRPTGETPSLGWPKNTLPRDPRQAEENGWKDLLVN